MQRDKVRTPWLSIDKVGKKKTHRTVVLRFCEFALRKSDSI